MNREIRDIIFRFSFPYVEFFHYNLARSPYYPFRASLMQITRLMIKYVGRLRSIMENNKEQYGVLDSLLLPLSCMPFVGLKTGIFGEYRHILEKMSACFGKNMIKDLSRMSLEHTVLKEFAKWYKKWIYIESRKRVEQ